MIVEVYIQGQRLDLYEDESINVTQTSKDIKDISKVFADFSQSFKVPASARNNEIFKHYYNANIDGGYDARIRKDANLVVGGLDFKRGKMRLDSVDVMNNEPTNYKITFFGSVIQIKDLIGEDKLFDLDWLSNFDYAYSGAQVKTGLTDGLSFTVDGVFFPRAIIYPLISYKRQFIYNSLNSDHTNTDTLVNIAYHSGHSGGSRHGVDYKDLKPAIRLSVIIKAIEKQYGLNFNSPFFQSDSFVRMYMNLNKSVESLVNGFVEVENVSGTIVPIFGFPLYWIYRLEITPLSGFESTPYKRRMYFNDELIYEDINFVYGTTSKQVNTDIGYDLLSYQVRSEIITEGSFEFEPYTSLRKRYYFFTTTSTQTVFETVHPDLTILIQTQILQNLQDIKVFDFITSLFKTFNLIAYSENDDIIIQDLPSWYTDGQIYDVTQFIETKKETVNRGTIFSKINFNFEKSSQILSDEFRQSNNQGYGDLDFVLSDENGNPLQDVDGETLEVKSIFENPIYERLNDLDDNSQTPIQYCLYTNREIKPIVGKPFIFFAIKPSLSATPISFLDETSQFEIDSDVFMPSHSEFTVNSFNLNFNAEISEYTGEVMQNTIYQRYWSDYIGDMFSVKRRTFLMEGILPPNLLNNLRLNDRLIIKGTRYIINKITSNLVDRRDQLELINDIYNAPLVSDVLNTSMFRQSFQTFDNGANESSVTYVGLSGKVIEIVDLGDGTTWIDIVEAIKLTQSENFELLYTVDANTSGLERSIGIRVSDDINNPIFVIIQQA